MHQDVREKIPKNSHLFSAEDLFFSAVEIVLRSTGQMNVTGVTQAAKSTLQIPMQVINLCFLLLWFCNSAIFFQRCCVVSFFACMLLKCSFSVQALTRCSVPACARSLHTLRAQPITARSEFRPVDSSWKSCLPSASALLHQWRRPVAQVCGCLMSLLM